MHRHQVLVPLSFFLYDHYFAHPLYLCVKYYKQLNKAH